MKRKVIVNSNCYHGFTIEDCIQGMKRAGFKNIELTATLGWTEHVMPNFSLSRLYDIKEMLQDNEIKVVALSGHTNLMDNNRINDFIQNMRLANFFGCEYIVSSIGEAHLENNAKMNSEMTAAQLIKLIPYLRKYELKLVLEVHGNDHGTGAKIKEITDLVNSDLIKINYDTANAIFYGDLNMYHDLEATINDIEYLHLKDKAGEKTEWNFPALGDGYIDFVKVKEILDNHHNSSPLSIEIEFTADGVKEVSDVHAALQRSYDYLNKIGMGDLDA